MIAAGRLLFAISPSVLCVVNCVWKSANDVDDDEVSYDSILLTDSLYRADLFSFALAGMDFPSIFLHLLAHNRAAQFGAFDFTHRCTIF